jgi:hypothetical protein
MADPQQQQQSTTPSATPVGSLDLSKSIPLRTAPAVQASAVTPAGPLDMSKSIPVSAAQSQPAQPSALARAGNAVVDAGKGIVNGVEYMVKPPETPTEGLMSHVGGDPGLFAYRAAKAVTEAGDRMVKAVPGEYQQAVADFKQAVDDFHNKNYRGAVTSAASGLAGVGDIANPIAPKGRELTEATRPGGDLATPLTKDALLVGSIVAPEFFGGLKNPFRNTSSVDAAGAVRQGVETGANVQGVATPQLVEGVRTNPILENATTVLDEPANAFKAKEAAAYKQIDQTAGFDLKELKNQLRNDQYEIKQLGTTPEDVARKAKLQSSITDASQRITDAEAKLSKAGIDPKAGDSVHTARMALQDFKNTLVKVTDPDGTINVDKLINQSKALRFSKRGDRLAQIMGQDGADTYMEQLQAAQKAGVHAMKAQKIAKWAAGLAGAVAIGSAATAGAKHVMTLLETP